MEGERFMIANDKVLNAKSVHIYAWPFELRQEETIQSVRNSIKNRGWVRKKWKALHPDDFMLRQYLSSSVRNIFMDEKEDAICEVYELSISENLRYIINDYELSIVGLELHLYHFGAGVLFIQTVNERYTSIDDIRKINDYGRRICLPYLPSTADGFILCAEQLGIRNMLEDDSEKYMTYFRKAIKKWHESPDMVEADVEKCLTHPADFLFRLLGCTDAQVEMTSDDRMFLVCLLRDTSLSKQIEKEYVQGNAELDTLLYQLIYVDSGAASCQNAKMREKLFEKSVYDRWADWGTIYGITNYSMICITAQDDDVKDGVVKPFIVEYIYFISLVLMQKIGIAFFSERAGNIVEGVDKPRVINRKQAGQLINLQEKYITFKNQLLILEASSQEQGIEIYKMLQKQLQVHEEESILDGQLESLYEVTNVSSGRRIEKWGLILAVSAIVVDVIINVVFWILG